MKKQIKGMTANVMMEQKVCLVTGETFDTGGILLREKMLKPENESNERFCITGYGFSPEVQEKLDNGFIALVEIDMTKSDMSGNFTPDKAWRTGRTIFIKKTAFYSIFKDAKCPDSFSYIPIDVFEYLENIDKQIRN